MVVVLSILLVIMITTLILGVINKYMPYKWFCNFWGWHLQPDKMGFDGCSATGKCPRCDKNVLLDGQGNWF